MKRIVIVALFSIIILLSVTAVKTANTTTIVNDAEIRLNTSESALISIIPSISDTPGFFRQGDLQKDLFIIRNNVGDVISYDINFFNDLITDFIKIEPLFNPCLNTGDENLIKISIGNFSPTGNFILDLFLSAGWDNGNASIDSEIQFEIKEGILILYYIDGNLKITWNGGSAPPETELFCRYSDLTNNWGNWVKLNSVMKITDGLPGKYEVRATLGKTFSNIIEIEVVKKMEHIILPQGDEGKVTDEEITGNIEDTSEENIEHN